MRWLAGIAALMAAAGQAASPHAAMSAKEIAETRKIMAAYAKCVVKSEHDRAAAAIIADADNATILKRYPDLISPKCLGKVAGSVSMAFGGDYYRYALADALVNADYAGRGDTDFSNRLPLAHLLPSDPGELTTAMAATGSKSQQAKLQTQAGRQSAIAWLSRFGECVVRHEPVKTRYWLLTPPDGPEETSRIDELRPTFGVCLQQGTLAFTRAMLRGTVAVNYFRLASATAQPAPVAR